VKLYLHSSSTLQWCCA